MGRRLTVFAFVSLPIVFGGCGGDDDGNGSGSSDAAAIDAASLPDSAPTPDAVTVDAGPQIDAMPAELACLGDPLPDTAPTTLTVSGLTTEVTLSGEEPLSGVDIEARQVSNDAVIDTTTSDADGEFTLTEDDSGESPVDAYVIATIDGYKDTYLWPPAPLTENTVDAPVLMIESTLVWPVLTAGQNQLAENGVVSLIVIDCDDLPVEGATVTASTSTQVVYADEDGLPDPNRTSTSTQGIAFIFNVPPGDVEVDAVKSGMSLREHTIESVADSLVTTLVMP